MSDRHSLGHAGGAGRENDPGVIIDDWCRGSPTARDARAPRKTRIGDDPRHGGLAEHQLGALLGVVGVDRHVGRTARQDRQDGHVQRVAAGRHADPDPVAPTDPACGKPACAFLEIGDHLGIGQLDLAVVDARGVREAAGGVIKNVDQRPRGRGLPRSQVLRRNLGHRHVWES